MTKRKETQSQTPESPRVPIDNIQDNCQEVYIGATKRNFVDRIEDIKIMCVKEI